MPTGAVEAFAGGPFLTIAVAEMTLDTDRVGPVTIRRGRRSADQRPEAAILGFPVMADALARLPELGDPVEVELSALMLAALGGDADHARRFTGTVTDVTTAPASEVVTVVAAGPRSRAARIPIGDVPWPAELDGARADRILDALVAVDPTFDVVPGDPGTVTVLPRDVDRQPAAALLDALAADTGGDAWETRYGELWWRDARSRAAGSAPALTLSAANVLVDPEFVRNLDGLVTDLEVEYGEPRATVRIVDTTAPITVLAARVSTQLSAAADAQAYAVEVVGRRSRPRWRVPDLGVDVLATLSADQRLALLAAEPGTLVEVTGMPTAAPFAGSQLWIEGWTETYTRHNWRFGLAVSPRGLTGAQARWIDIPATYVPAEGEPAEPLTWSSPSFAGLSWLGGAGWWSETVTEGRWADVPANLRWENYPPDTLWSELP